MRIWTALAMSLTVSVMLWGPRCCWSDAAVSWPRRPKPVSCPGSGDPRACYLSYVPLFGTFGTFK